MSETPFFMPLAPAEYLRDTLHLSTLEHGAYFLLLMHAWSHEGVLPIDEKRLARIAGLTPKEWKEAREVLLDFFHVEDGIRRQKRVDRELARARGLIDQKRAAGKASAAARAAKREGNGRCNARSTDVGTDPPTEGQRDGNQVQVQEEEGSVTDVTGGKPPDDPIKQLFDSGVSILTSAGKSDAQARSLIGKWRKRHGDGPVASVLATASGKSEPVAWIEASLAGQVRGTDEFMAVIDRKYGPQPALEAG